MEIEIEMDGGVRNTVRWVARYWCGMAYVYLYCVVLM